MAGGIGDATMAPSMSGLPLCFPQVVAPPSHSPACQLPRRMSRGYQKRENGQEDGREKKAQDEVEWTKGGWLLSVCQLDTYTTV